VSTHSSLGRISSKTHSTILFKNESDIDRLNVPYEKRCATEAGHGQSQFFFVLKKFTDITSFSMVEINK